MALAAVQFRQTIIGELITCQQMANPGAAIVQPDENEIKAAMQLALLDAPGNTGLPMYQMERVSRTHGVGGIN